VDPQSQQLLEETAELAKENNQMLRSMRRSMRWSQIMNTVYWLFIIGTAIGAFYFLQPYIAQLESAYNSASGVLKTLNGGK